MMTRRVFLKNGSAGAREPRLHAGVHRARRAGGAGAQEDPRRDLPARRRGRPEHGRAVRRAGLLREPAVDRDSASPNGARTAARSISTGSSACIRGWRRSRRYFKGGELAIVHACGSHDDTRSHFDAQDYMESGTPGLKSTRDGWLNRYLHAKEHDERRRPFRAVALAPQLPRTLQGTAPALAIGQLGQFGVRAGTASDMMASGFEAQYAQAADPLLRPTGKEAFDAVKMLKDANPARLHAGQRRRVPALGLRRRDAADRADHQGRPRPRSRVRRARQLGSPRQRRRVDRPDRQPPRRVRAAASPRSPATSATAWPTSSSSRCRSSAAR